MMVGVVAAEIQAARKKYTTACAGEKCAGAGFFVVMVAVAFLG